jgi:MFS family permease
MVDTIPSPAGPAAVAPRPVSLWRNRDFLLLWSGQIVSSFGTQASQLAFPLLMLAVTGSPLWAGVLGACRGLPFVVLSLPVGALVDRWDRKRVMILSDIGRALALGSVPLAMVTGHLSIVQLCLVAVIEGMLFTFFNLAEAACLPRVVPKEQLPAAVARSQATESTAEMVGPSLGGALYGLGSGLPFLVDAVSFVLSAWALRSVRAALQGERAQAAASGGARRLWTEIGEGLAWLWNQPLLRFLALLTGGLNLFSFGYVLIIIVFSQQLGSSPVTIGLLLASGGVVSFIGALVV